MKDGNFSVKFATQLSNMKSKVSLQSINNIGGKEQDSVYHCRLTNPLCPINVTIRFLHLNGH